MRTYVVAFFLSLGIAALTTPLVLRVAKRLRLFDAPDGERKVHTAPIPRLGGIAIAAGFIAPIIGLLFYTNTFAVELRLVQTRIIAFLGGFAAILLLGLWDDLKGIGAWPKLLVQCGVGVLLWSGGLAVEEVTVIGHKIVLGAWSLPLTVIWVAAMVNAMNLIDGLDGLAGGVAMFAATSLFTVAVLDAQPVLALFAAALAGSALGFLLYNFAPAMIFMGDSGSMTIGYIFASSALWSSGKRATAFALLLSIIALGVPIFDTVFAFARRAISGRSPFSSDRGHVHHRLIDAGLSHRQAVLALYTVCAALTAVVIVMRSTEDPTWGAVVVGLFTTIFIVARVMVKRTLAIQKARKPSDKPPDDAVRSRDDDAGDGEAEQPGGVVVRLRRRQR